METKTRMKRPKFVYLFKKIQIFYSHWTKLINLFLILIISFDLGFDNKQSQTAG